MQFRLALIPLLVVSLAANVAFAASDLDQLTCGIADGYPPYQFLQQGQAAGLDIEVLKQVVDNTGVSLTIQQEKWDNVVGLLRYRSIDCVGGMEINEARQQLFDFTRPYYYRKSAIFVLADNQQIRSIDDLQGQKVAGDRHSFVEQYFQQQGLHQGIRLFQSDSKSTSMKLLKANKVVAVIAPKAVGLYLANQLGISVRQLDTVDIGTPVAIAVAKGNTRLLETLNARLHKLQQSGAIDTIVNKWVNGATYVSAQH